MRSLFSFRRCSCCLQKTCKGFKANQQQQLMQFVSEGARAPLQTLQLPSRECMQLCVRSFAQLAKLRRRRRKLTSASWPLPVRKLRATRNSRVAQSGQKKVRCNLQLLLAAFACCSFLSCSQTKAVCISLHDLASLAQNIRQLQLCALTKARLEFRSLACLRMRVLRATLTQSAQLEAEKFDLLPQLKLKFIASKESNCKLTRTSSSKSNNIAVSTMHTNLSLATRKRHEPDMS